MEKLTAFVLAGGRSSRMGSDKAFLKVGGQTLLDRTLGVADKVAAKTVIVGPRERYSAYGETVEDVYSDCGPMSGIHAALASTATDLNLILSVDLPKLEPEFLSWLAEQAANSRELAVIPQTPDGIQPLCGIYRRSLLPLVEKMLTSDDYKVDHLFSQAPTRYLSPQEIQAAGFSSNLFLNVNTPQEYEILVGGTPTVVEVIPASRGDEEVRQKPEHDEAKPYIEFQDVSKAFGSNVVLKTSASTSCSARRSASWDEAAWANRFRCTRSWAF